MSNIILGTAVGYDIQAVQPFMLSLNESDYSGRIVLFIDDMNNDTAKYLRDKSAELHFYEPSHIPVASHRFFLYKRFIEKENNVEQIMISDVRDVIFQCDPFTVCNGNYLYCFTEDRSMTLSTCPYNSNWILQAYGANMLNELGHNPIICSGITIGNRGNIVHYTEVLCKELAKVPPIQGIDQGVHNVIIRSGLVSNTVIYDNESSPVYTLAYVKPDSIKTDKSGYVLNGFGIPCVVHQYDRHPPLFMEIQKKYIFQKLVTSPIDIVKAKYGDTVQVHWSASLKDGTVIVHSFNLKPLEFTLGKGQMFLEFEQAVVEMCIGEWKTININSGKAFGPHREELVFRVGRYRFPAELKIEVGQHLQIPESSGQTINGTVVNCSESEVTLDTNNPLAGKDLIFSIQLIKII